MGTVTMVTVTVVTVTMVTVTMVTVSCYNGYLFLLPPTPGAYGGVLPWFPCVGDQ